jgi:MinD-like ATPase involved in chromosome partitioning or flagellar assembly
MSTDGMEIFLVSATAGLSEALAAYEGVNIGSGALDFAARLLSSDRPPQVIYVEDTACGNVDGLWGFVQAARARQVTVLVSLQGIGLNRMTDFVDAGLPITDARGAAEISAWIGAQLGVRRRASVQQTVIAVAGAKGGIGKTVVVSSLAEGFKRRGLRVLVVDGDLSNSGIVPSFRIPSGFPSYLHIEADGPNAWAPENVRRYIYKHPATGIDFLLGSEQTVDPADMQRQQWMALMQAVRAIEGYDVVLVDTGPEIKKRPYALLVARDGGYVVLPSPPGRKEREGTGKALVVFEQAVAGRDLTDHCLLLFMEPEKGVTVTIPAIAPLFAQRFPRVRTIGTLPRDPHLLSVADENQDRYVCPLDLKPYSKFSIGLHQVVENLCGQVGLHPRLPMPQASFIQRTFGNRTPKIAAQGTAAYGGAS